MGREPRGRYDERALAAAGAGTAMAFSRPASHATWSREACLRLYAESPDPVLLRAAARGCELLG